MRIIEILKTYIMNKITVRELLIKTIDKYIESKPQINQDFNDRKIQNIKETIHQMIMECFESCIPSSKKASLEKYIELTDIIISHIIENYNKYLPIKIHIDPSKIQKFIEKVKYPDGGQPSNN